MKKLFALGLVLVLSLGICSSVFATEYANALKYDDIRVKNTNIQGNSKIKIKLNSKSADSDIMINDTDGANEVASTTDITDSPEFNQRIFTVEDKIELDLFQPDYVEISEYIVKNIEPQFDINNFEEYVIQYDDDNNGMIQLTQLIDGLQTDFEINIFVSNGFVTFISANGKLHTTPLEDKFLFPLTEKEVCDLALENSKYDKSTVRVEAQHVLKKLDTTTNKPYYLVFTDFEDMETGTCLSEEYIQKF